MTNCAPFSIAIHNAKTCTAQGLLDAGGMCSRLTNADTNLLTFGEYLDFLQAQPERVCVPVPGFSVCAEDQSKGEPVTLPARGAAIALSTEDFNQIATALKTLCRKEGKRCTYETEQIIESMLKISRP